VNELTWRHFFFNQEKNVSIIIIGVGQAAKNFKNEMEVLAGSRRQVILFDSFEELTRRIVDEFKSKSCGRLGLLRKNNVHSSPSMRGILRTHRVTSSQMA